MNSLHWICALYNREYRNNTEFCHPTFNTSELPSLWFTTGTLNGKQPVTGTSSEMKAEFGAYWTPELIKDQPNKIHFQPAERNKQPILETLQKHIGETSSGKLLEISSGSGQHVAHIAPKFPSIIFQPSEYEDRYISSIGEYIKDDGLKNVLRPLHVDVSLPLESWGGGQLEPNRYDYVLNVNLMHVAPWTCTEGLFNGVSAVLKPGGLLFTYGPFADNGVIKPDSNVDFDRKLRAHDPSWGLRDIQKELIPLATKFNMELIERYELPANNKILVWKKN